MAAGAGRNPDDESARLSVIVDWMWKCLALLQPVADERGFGAEWSEMCRERTSESAKNAATARSVNVARTAATWAAVAVERMDADESILWAVNAVLATVAKWDHIDPIELLNRMVSI